MKRDLEKWFSRRVASHPWSWVGCSSQWVSCPVVWGMCSSVRSACSQRNHGALIVARDEETLGHSAFSSVCVCVCVCVCVWQCDKEGNTAGWGKLAVEHTLFIKAPFFWAWEPQSRNTSPAVLSFSQWITASVRFSQPCRDTLIRIPQQLVLNYGTYLPSMWISLSRPHC